MANLTESNSWEAGVYQIELTDPVVGGPDGLSNVQAKQLANRTTYLKTILDALVSGATAVGKATKLAVARTINGVPFDGSANITIVDSTKEPTIAAGTNSQLWLGNKTWASVLTQVQGTLLTGYAVGANTALVATDTLLAALQKLQGQINAKEPTIAAGTAAQFWAGTKAWADFATTVRAAVLTGLSTATSTAVTATDSVLVAVGKLQAQASLALAQATEAALGIAKIATQTQADAGIDDATIVTPKKLRWGFSISLTANGYIVFPTWLGGLIIQWGATSTNATADVTAPLPIAFPSAFFSLVNSTDYSPGSGVVGSASMVINGLNSFVVRGGSSSPTIRYIAVGK